MPKTINLDKDPIIVRANDFDEARGLERRYFAGMRSLRARAQLDVRVQHASARTMDDHSMLTQATVVIGDDLKDGPADQLCRRVVARLRIYATVHPDGSVDVLQSGLCPEDEIQVRSLEHPNVVSHFRPRPADKMALAMRVVNERASRVFGTHPKVTRALLQSCERRSSSLAIAA